ncbi:MAG: GDP-fucose synthetase [Rhodospirillales bacterium RIFCSPLOWO2_12_FULL_58_28]|nr:MAG: GDP-fucose synthetase [Rhodospirillales bacterium RIFCSPLOWO2_02_FULL_58_16]OHC78892.1 MAG: GDP-fucose synthetase [Rhodospirillales bacterium RIFCSPLOWO2_12_FULL_58_28]
MTGKTPFSLSGKRIMVAGGQGMVGSALMRRLSAEDCQPLSVGREQVDLRRQADVEAWMAEHKPQVAIIAAATVGGIFANNTRPAEFIYDNLAIETNLVHSAWKAGVEKLLLLGTSCIYPKHAEQPMAEEALLTGPLEPTNQWYAIAKIAGIRLCQAYRLQYGCDFIAAQPTNLYGPGDRFDLNVSHVIPALMLKAHMAKERGDKTMEVWGSGAPLREFMYVDDLADALVFLIRNYSGEIQINIGTGNEISIGDLAKTICRVVGFTGELTFDATKPDGTPRKLVDASRLSALGWKAKTGLDDGLKQAYRWYLENIA